MKKLLMLVVLFSLCSYVAIAARIPNSKNRVNIKSIDTARSSENDNIITAEPLLLNDNCYYFVSGDKVIEFNLISKEFKNYAICKYQPSGFWLQVGLDGNIYEIALNTSSDKNEEKELHTGKREIKSTRASTNEKSKADDNKKSTKSRNIKSAAVKSQEEIKKIFSVVGRDGFVYEYNLESRTIVKKEPFDGEIKENFVQLLDENNELQEIEISLENKAQSTDEQTSRTKSIKSIKRDTRSVGRTSENVSELLQVKLKSEYIEKAKTESKKSARSAATVELKPLNINKGSEYFYWIEGNIIYEINIGTMKAKEFSKFTLNDKSKWFAVRSDGEIISFPLISEKSSERKNKTGPRSARGKTKTEEFKPIEVPKTDSQNFYFVGKDNYIYLLDRVNNEITKIKEYDGDLKEGNICIIFQDGNKIEAPISELISTDDEQESVGSQRGVRSARTRNADLKSKKTKSARRGVKSVNSVTGKEEIIELSSTGKTVSASSSPYIWSPADAVIDGNIYSSWSSNYRMTQNTNEWIKIDLGKNMPVRKIRICWGSCYPVDYKIQISSDNSNWKDIVSRTNETNNYYEYKEFFANDDGRYVCVYMSKQKYSCGSYYMNELEVYCAISANDKIQEVDDLITGLPETAAFEKYFKDSRLDTVINILTLNSSLMTVNQYSSSKPKTFESAFNNMPTTDPRKKDLLLLYNVAKEKINAAKKIGIAESDFSTFEKYKAIMETVKQGEINMMISAIDALPEPSKLEAMDEYKIQMITQFSISASSDSIGASDIPNFSKLQNCLTELRSVGFNVKKVIFMIDNSLPPITQIQTNQFSSYTVMINTVEQMITAVKNRGAKDEDITNLSKFNDFKRALNQIPIQDAVKAIDKLPDTSPLSFSSENEYSTVITNYNNAVNMYNIAKSKGATDGDISNLDKYKKVKSVIDSIQSEINQLNSECNSLFTNVQYNWQVAYNKLWQNRDKVKDLINRYNGLKSRCIPVNGIMYIQEFNSKFTDLQKLIDSATAAISKIPAIDSIDFFDTMQSNFLIGIYNEIQTKINDAQSIKIPINAYGYSINSTGITENDLPGIDNFKKFRDKYNLFNTTRTNLINEFNSLYSVVINPKTPIDNLSDSIAKLRNISDKAILWGLSANSFLGDTTKSKNVAAAESRIAEAIKRNADNEDAAKLIAEIISKLPNSENVTLNDSGVIYDIRSKINALVKNGYTESNISNINKFTACEAVIAKFVEEQRKIAEAKAKIAAALTVEYNKLPSPYDKTRMDFDIVQFRDLKKRIDEAIKDGVVFTTNFNKFDLAENLYNSFLPKLNAVIEAIDALPDTSKVTSSVYTPYSNQIKGTLPFVEFTIRNALGVGFKESEFTNLAKYNNCKTVWEDLKAAIKSANDALNAIPLLSSGKVTPEYLQSCEKAILLIDAAKQKNAVDADFSLLGKLDAYKNTRNAVIAAVEKLKNAVASNPPPEKDKSFDRTIFNSIDSLIQEAKKAGAIDSDLSANENIRKWIDFIDNFNAKISAIYGSISELSADAKINESIKSTVEKIRNDIEALKKIGAVDSDFKNLAKFTQIESLVKYWVEYESVIPAGDDIIRPNENLRNLVSKNKAFTLNVWCSDNRIGREAFGAVNLAVKNSINETLWSYKFGDNTWNYIGLRLTKNGRIVGLRQQRPPATTTNAYIDKNIYEQGEAFNVGDVAYLQLTEKGDLTLFDKNGKELKKLFENTTPYIPSDDEFKSWNLPVGDDILSDGKFLTTGGQEKMTSKNGLYIVRILLSREESLGQGNYKRYGALTILDKDNDIICFVKDVIGNKLIMRRDGQLLLQDGQKFISQIGAYLQIDDNNILAMYDKDRKKVYEFAQGPKYNFRKEIQKKATLLALDIYNVIQSYNKNKPVKGLDFANALLNFTPLDSKIAEIKSAGAYDTEIVLYRNDKNEIIAYAPYISAANFKPDEFNEFYKIKSELTVKAAEYEKSQAEKTKKYSRNKLNCNEELKPDEPVYHPINLGVQLVFEPAVSDVNNAELKIIWPPAENENRQTKVYWRQTAAGGKRCVMRTDGNLVILDKNNKIVWESETENNPGAEVSMDTANVLQILVEGKPAVTRTERIKQELIKAPKNGQTNLLWTGTVMKKGEYIKYTSIATYILRMTDKGRLEYVINRFDKDKIVWGTDVNSIGEKCVIEDNGDMALYDKDNKIIWHSDKRIVAKRDIVYMIGTNGDLIAKLDPNDLDENKLWMILDSAKLEKKWDDDEAYRNKQIYDDWKLQRYIMKPGRTLKSGEILYSSNDKSQWSITDNGITINVDKNLTKDRFDLKGRTQFFIMTGCAKITLTSAGDLYFYYNKDKVIKKFEKGWKDGRFYLQDGGQLIFQKGDEYEILWNLDEAGMEEKKWQIFGPKGMGYWLEAGDVIEAGNSLKSVIGNIGEQFQKNGKVNNSQSRLDFQSDGNLVMKSYYNDAKYDEQGKPTINPNEISYWETKTGGRGAKLKILENGNLVILDKSNNIIWEAGTSGYPQALFTITDDHRILLRDSLGNRLATAAYKTIVVDVTNRPDQPSDLENAIKYAKQLKEAWDNPASTLAKTVFGSKSPTQLPEIIFKVVTRDVSQEYIGLSETVKRSEEFITLTSKQQKAKQAAIDAINDLRTTDVLYIDITDKDKVANAKKMVDAAIAEGVKESEISYSIKFILDSLEKAIVQLEEAAKKTSVSAPSNSAANSAVPTNLALGKTSTASSLENSSNVAANAFDGNVGTRWASVGSDPQWLMVDLGAAAVISKVVLTWEAAAAKVYKIQVSTDKTNWTDVASVTDGTSNQKRELTINNAKASYVRMYGTQRATNWGYSIWEFEVWGVYTGASASSAVDDGKPKNGSSYKIQAKHSGMLMSVDNSGIGNGANVSQQPDNNLNSQIWKLEDMGAGYFKLVNKNSGRCLDVDGVSTANGGNLHQWDYVNGNNQVWKFEDMGNGYYKIVVKHCGKCVDVAGGSKNAGGNIQQWDYTGGDNQVWKLIEVK